MGLIGFLLNPVRYVLGQTMRDVFEPEVRTNPIIVHAEAQSDDVGTSGGGVGQKHDGTAPVNNRGNGFRPAKEAKQGFKPQYVVPLRKPRNDIEAQRLYNHIRTLAYYLDAIPFLGRRLPFNIGVDSIIGLIPGVGDYIGLVLSTYALVLCILFGLPITLLAMMIFNIVLDCFLGLIPLLGDALDVAFKANLRNLRLLEDHLISNDGKCGAGHFNLIFPPSNEFMPKNGPQEMFVASNGNISASGKQSGQSVRRKAANGEGSSIALPDGTRKQNWTWTDGDAPKLPGGSQINSQFNTESTTDFCKGTMEDRTEGEYDQRRNFDSKQISAWSVAVVPTEIFTTILFTPNGISIAQMCAPLLRWINRTKMFDQSLDGGNEFPLWNRHMNRLKKSTEKMRESNPDSWKVYPFDESKIRDKIQEHLKKVGTASSRRMRVAITNTGEILITSFPISKTLETGELKQVRIDPIAIPIDHLKENEWMTLCLKTGYRAMYDNARNRVYATLGMNGVDQEGGDEKPCFDVLLQGQLSDEKRIFTESSIANIIIVLNPGDGNAQAITPALRTKDENKQIPLLAGLMRQELLDKGLIKESIISVERTKQLVQSGQATLFLCNALRGTIPVELID